MKFMVTGHGFGSELKWKLMIHPIIISWKLFKFSVTKFYIYWIVIINLFHTPFIVQVFSYWVLKFIFNKLIIFIKLESNISTIIKNM